MALKMTNREVDGVSVVALDGRIVLGEESNALREKVKGLLAEGKKKIVLNMDNITFIDSAGLGTLVAAHHSAKGQGASLRQPLGITVMGGLILSQVFTLYTTPVIYLYLDRLRSKLVRWSSGLPWNRQAEQMGPPRQSGQTDTKA